MLYIIIGLIGSLLMFAGDMLLYYTPQDFDYESQDKNNDRLKPVIDVMKKLSPKRVTFAGLIGPVAAVLYCIGFYHIVVITNENWHIASLIAFICLCVGIISGGAYHSHCAYLGLLGDEKYQEARSIVVKYFSKIGFVLYVGEGIGLILLLILIVSGNTVLPQWMIILSPGILFLLRPLVKKLPKGIRVIVFGGWTNLIFVIYYLAVLICVLTMGLL